MRCSRDGSRVGRIFPVTPHGPTTMTLLLARAIAFLFFVGLVAPGSAAADAGPPSPPEWQGHWSGTVAFRGDAWPIRLALPGELADATIDLPDLWMAWEPVTVNTGIDADAVVVALPFGWAMCRWRVAARTCAEPARSGRTPWRSCCNATPRWN